MGENYEGCITDARNKSDGSVSYQNFNLYLSVHIL